MEETYKLNELWIGADFRLAPFSDSRGELTDPEDNYRYCFIGIDRLNSGRIQAAKIDFDEAIVASNEIVTFPPTTEVYYVLRGESNVE